MSSFPPLQSNLIFYGKCFSDRFFHETSSLHECQKEALRGIVGWFSSKDTEDLTAVVVMPTGSGKTGVICCLPYVIGGAIADGIIHSINIGKPILVIAPGLDILQQLMENLHSSNCFLLKKGLLSEAEMQYYYIVDTVTKTSDLAEPQEIFRCSNIILSNAQKWRKNERGMSNYEELPPDLFSMVIVDEAHHVPASQWEDIVQKFRAYAKVVFFTATPERADMYEITTDHAISTNGYAYQLTRQQAIDRRLIREVRPVYLDTLLELPEIVQPIIERLMYAEQVLAQIKARILQKNMECPLPGNIKHSAIIITKSIKDANAVKRLCVQQGFAEDEVLVMHNKITRGKKGVRDEMLRNIQDGKYAIVIIVKMLLEGFDYPPFSIAGIVTRITSPVKFAHFVGRVQRLVRQPTVEENVVGDIITHEYFDQKEMFERYVCPHIPLEDENESLDGDYEDEDSEDSEEDWSF